MGDPRQSTDHENPENAGAPQQNHISGLLDHRTQFIELRDHHEYFSDNEGLDEVNNGDELKKPFDDFEIPADETQGGYASGPETLEHSTIQPFQVESQPQ